MKTHDPHSCRVPDCGACERYAEDRDDFDRDPYGWQADRAAERHYRSER